MARFAALALIGLALADFDLNKNMDSSWDSLLADPFRVGSGAVASSEAHSEESHWAAPAEAARLKLERSGLKNEPVVINPGKHHKPFPIIQKIAKHNHYLLWFVAATLVLHMLWIMLTDLQPHQQCAAIIMRLGGSAREMARMITPQEMMNGGMLNGVMVDAVTYLLGSLHAKFSALEEESRLSAMTEMLAFARKPGETINGLLARYEVVRQRAAVEGQFVMSTEGCSL